MFSKYFPAIVFIFSILLISCGGDVKKDEPSAESYEVGTSIMKNLTNNFLTVADIQKVTDMAGVKLVPKNLQLGALGDLNFFTYDNKPIVYVTIAEKIKYNDIKQNYFKREVKELGDQAMIGASAPGYNEDVLAFTKGNTCIFLLVLINTGNSSQVIKSGQMIELAKIIESRMDTKIY